MTGRHFATWEGTNLNVSEDWTSAHLLRGAKRLAARQYREALVDFQTATKIPDNLPAGRGGASRSAEANYWVGAAYEGLGNQMTAKMAWTTAVSPSAPAGGRGGRGGQEGMMNPAQSYYRALAMRKLGQTDEAKTALQALVSGAERTLQNAGAEGGETGGRGAAARGAGRRGAQSTQNPQLQAHYAAALGHLGLGENDLAKQEFRAALAINPAHLGARSMLDSLNRQ